MQRQRPWEPPRLYSWTVVDDGEAGVLGVSSDYERALARAAEALQGAPAGARGLVHRVMLSFSRSAYIYEGLVARCLVDAQGTVVWDDLPRPSSWAQMAPVLADHVEVRGDAMPPEAIAAGLNDLAAHEKRLQQTTSSVVNSPTGRS